MSIKSLFKGIISLEELDSYPDAVVIVNKQRNIIFWSRRAEEILGLERKYVVNRNLEAIFGESIKKIYQKSGENQSLIIKFADTPERKIKRNGNVFIEITCNYQVNKEEQILVFRDVTKNQTLIEKLMSEYEKVLNISLNKSGFIADLSHEIRTPIHSIIGFSQALIDGLGGELSDKQKKYISIISKNANNLLTLLNSILDISKIEAGKMEFNFKPFDVHQLLNLVSEIINPMLKEKKLNFTLELSDQVKRSIYSDENMLRQVLLNLLTNAVKFTELGDIKMKVSYPELETVKMHGFSIPDEFTEKSYLMFQIADTGIGIAKEDFENIFNEYRQLDRAASKKYGGTGLGLPITLKILRELGGVIWVVSEVSKGSIFSFIIPIERIKTPEEVVEPPKEVKTPEKA